MFVFLPIFDNFCKIAVGKNAERNKSMLCRIELLGPLRLLRGEEVVTRFGTQKAAGLLAYLALRPGPHARETLIDVFWPDMDLPEGRNNLSTALSSLRRLLEPPDVPKGTLLTTTHSQAGLHPAAVTTDVAEFEGLLREAESAEAPAARAALLTCALALHGGSFQAGNFQDWAVREAERLEGRRLVALDALAEDLEHLGRIGEAVDVTCRRLAADPFSEVAQVGLIRRQVHAGQTAAARETARTLETLFQEEFGTGPREETRRAIEEIFAQPPVFAAVPPAAVALSTQTALPETAAHKSQAAPPLWLSRFFGREAEMARLADLLLPSKHPATLARLVTLTGPGGAGKTRLAAEFGHRLSEHFGHWCGFVSLADLSAPDQIPARILQSLALSPVPTLMPLEQVHAFFAARRASGEKPALLILDNLEHLLGVDTVGVDTTEGGGTQVDQIVRALLGPNTGLSILATSRRRLGLSGEHLLPLGPLPVPDMDRTEDLSALGHILSVCLYVDRAQTVRPDFNLTPTNAAAVAALCRGLDGSPLALELAASWVRLLPPRKMWERLGRGEDLPEGRLADLPTRHRSLAAALDWSWRLLTPGARRLLARLSVFRGGWTLDAAEAVGSEPDPLALLAELADASLVTTREDAAGEVRYGLLETVRQFAARRLETELAETGASRGRHLNWAAALAREADAQIRTAAQAACLQRLDAEHDNLRAAIDWALSADCPVPPPGEPPAGYRLATALAMFWLIRGHLREGRAWASALLAQSCPWEQRNHRAHLLNMSAMLANEQGEQAAARRFLEEELQIRRTLDNPGQLGSLLNNLGIVLHDQGDIAGAGPLWEEALVLMRVAESPLGIASCLSNLGELAFEQGDAGKAQHLLEEALPLHRAIGSKFNIAYLLNLLAAVSRHRGDFDAAHRFLVESLPLLDEIGNRAGIARSLETATALALGASQAARAASLAGAAAALREEIAAPLPANEAARHAEDLAAVRAALGNPVFEAAWAAGRLMTWEQAVAPLLAESI